MLLHRSVATILRKSVPSDRLSFTATTTAHISNHLKNLKTSNYPEAVYPSPEWIGQGKGFIRVEDLRIIFMLHGPMETNNCWRLRSRGRSGMSGMEEWVAVSEEKQLKEGSGLSVNPKGLPVLLLKRSGQVFAISNRCPHLGCALAGGSISGYILTCPCHDWRFDIRTGEFLSAREIKLPIYDFKIESGTISIRIER